MRLTQVLANLLNNAAKYTDKGGTIALSARRDGDGAVISVRDNGCGISKAGLDRISRGSTDSPHWPSAFARRS